MLNLGGTTLEEAYKVLEIEPTATDTEVKAAYRKLAMKHHPTVLPHSAKIFTKQPKKNSAKSTRQKISSTKLATSISIQTDIKTKKSIVDATMDFFCDSYRIQTCNLLIRSQMLYSVELRSR